MRAGRTAWARWTRPLVMACVVVLMVGGVVLLVAASPVVLSWIARSGRDWGRLGDVGQAYGGASAVLSGLALCGVALSLVLQWRQARIAQLYSARHHQFNLTRLALEHPDAFVVDGAAATSEPHVSSMIIVNQWVASWATAWQLGALSEASLRGCCERLFEVAFVRQWWRAWGSTYATSARGRRFVEVLDQECEARDRLALPVPPSTADRDRVSPTNRRAVPVQLWQAVAVVAVTAAVVSAVRRKMRTPGGPSVTGVAGRTTPPESHE